MFFDFVSSVFFNKESTTEFENVWICRRVYRLCFGFKPNKSLATTFFSTYVFYLLLLCVVVMFGLKNFSSCGHHLFWTNQNTDVTVKSFLQGVRVRARWNLSTSVWRFGGHLNSKTEQKQEKQKHENWKTTKNWVHIMNSKTEKKINKTNMFFF